MRGQGVKISFLAGGPGGYTPQIVGAQAYALHKTRADFRGQRSSATGYRWEFAF